MHGTKHAHGTSVAKVKCQISTQADDAHVCIESVCTPSSPNWLFPGAWPDCASPEVWTWSHFFALFLPFQYSCRLFTLCLKWVNVCAKGIVGARELEGVWGV